MLAYAPLPFLQRNTMFRPIPEAALFRRIPYRLIASVLLIVALVITVILLFSLEQGKFLLQGFSQGKADSVRIVPGSLAVAP